MRKFKFFSHLAFYNLFYNPRNKLNMLSGVTLLLISTGVYSADNPFETTADFTAASCPSGHKMYYMGANAPASTPANPVAKQTLSWGSAGTTNRSIIFEESSGNKTFKIQFSGLKDLNNDVDKPPFFGPNRGVTSSAINLEHNSPVSNLSRTNHILDVTVDRNVSKIGYKIQDLDSTTVRNGQVPYIEQADVSLSGGQLTSFPAYHDINNDKNIVTALRGRNCDIDACTISATWPYKIANTAVNLKHNNFLSENNSVHAIGYSDFYFCLAPPKLIVKKVLTGTRFNDSDTKRDQFNIKVAGGKLTPDSQGSTASFTTTGAGSTITNGSTVTPLELAPSTTYTISENIINGDATNYNTSYVCSNATTGSNSSTPSGNTSSFTLSNLNYGDEVTCIITNTPKSYSFSGIVFNDNGKIINPTKDDVSDKYLNNNLYFNGKYDSSNELGIPFTSGHTITLNKCTGDTSTFTPQTVNINPDGTYSFTLTPAQLGSNTRLCATQNEPNNYTYSVDTTSNVRQINITNNTFNYPDNNFGDVIQDNAALVLFKSQYVHDCSLTDLTTISVNYTGSASTVYSTNPISNIIPGQCIAYRIEAVNRGNVPLTDIIIRDTLQKKGENGALVTSTLATPTPIGENSGVPSFSNSSVSIGNNGQVLTNGFPLGITSSDRRRAIRFNTEYGTTVNP